VIDLVDCAEEHRWLLREWRNSDLVAPYMYDREPIPRDAHDRWYTRLLQRVDRRGWVITMDGTPVGACFITGHDPEHHRAIFGLYLADPSTRGRGVGGAAQYLLCEKAFDELRLHKLCCEALGFNEQAIAMYKKMGFVEEGVLREQLLRDEEWVDVHLLALFERAWSDQRDALAEELRERGLIS